jgi:transposase
MSARNYQRYSQDFKQKALGLLSLGTPIKDVARDLQVSVGLLYAWKREAPSLQGGSAGLRAVGEQSEADALKALRREVSRLKAENEILKKAAIILGHTSQSSYAL